MMTSLQKRGLKGWRTGVGLVLAMLIAAGGCGKSDNERRDRTASEPRQTASEPETMDTNVDRVLGRSAILKGKVYIDSVPRGAHVYLVRESAKGGDKELGVTPLAIDPNQCPGMKFWIMMTVEEYVNRTKDLPGMKEWVEDFQTQNYFGGIGLISAFFDFDTGETRTGVEPGTNALLLFGPVYKLQWPMMNRVCALFIPTGKKVSVFYPLMPPRGTFQELKGEWRKNLVSKYKFTEEQAVEALECLSRCGKYVARIKNPYKEGWAMEYSITAQGPECPLIYITQREVRD